MPNPRICIYCKKEFMPQRIGNRPNGQPRYSERKYCSDECMLKHDEEKALAIKNICQVCGKEFDRVKIGYGDYGKRKICPECTEKQKEQAKNYKQPATKICWNCHKELTEEQKLKFKYYCSETCKLEYKKIKDKTCLYCGKKYDAKLLPSGHYSSSVFCSDICSKNYYNQKYNNNKTRKCEYCGKEFKLYILPCGDWSKDRYCSEECIKLAENLKYNKNYKYIKCQNPACGKMFKVYRAESGDFQNIKYCSDECYRICSRRNHQKAWNIKTEDEKQEIYDKRIQTCMKKYGVPYSCLTENCRNSNEQKISSINVDFASKLQILLNETIELDTIIIYDRCYDLFLKSQNTLIEINPTYTHSCIDRFYSGKDKNYHKDKTKLARDNGYKCVNIWSWDNEQKIINMFIPKQKLYARNLEIKGIDKQIANTFLDMYHLQNSCRGNLVNLGLYQDEELIQVMTFGKPRYNKNYQWELLRLCTKSGYYVVGGAERLFKHFVIEHNPESMISYCDISKFSGEIYSKLGFSLTKETEPAKIWSKNSDYITDNLLRQRGADQLIGTNDGKGTDNEEIMLREGWLPVYDCGQKVFVWTRS